MFIGWRRDTWCHVVGNQLILQGFPRCPGSFSRQCIPTEHSFPTKEGRRFYGQIVWKAAYSIFFLRFTICIHMLGSTGSPRVNEFISKICLTLFDQRCHFFSCNIHQHPRELVFYGTHNTITQQDEVYSLKNKLLTVYVSSFTSQVYHPWFLLINHRSLPTMN